MPGSESFEAMNESRQPGPSAPVGDPLLPCGQEEQRMVWVRIALRDHLYRITSDVRYELEVKGRVYEGRTGKEAKIEQKVSADASSGVLRLWFDGDEGKPTTWKLKIGAMDPLGTETGVQARLRNLGIYEGEIDGVIGPKTERAIWHFQWWVGLKPTGRMDDATRTALAIAYDFGPQKGRPQGPLPKGER